MHGTRRRRLKKRILLYTVSEANGGLVFATPERAKFVSRIHKAIENSTTWAEFRKTMPRAEYAEVFRCVEGNLERRPRGGDPFRPEHVPGYIDGDYPPWLQQEMDAFIPHQVVERFGNGERTFLNGDYTHLDPADLTAIKELLNSHGYLVKDGSHLPSWY